MCSGVNLIINHPGLFISVALLLIPETWFLRPLLRIFGFGPLGPVKGNEIHLFSVSGSLTILGLRICCCMGTGATLGRCYQGGKLVCHTPICGDENGPVIIGSSPFLESYGIDEQSSHKLSFEVV